MGSELFFGFSATLRAATGLRPATEAMAGALKRASRALLRERPYARYVLVRAQMHYTTRHYATVMQSQKWAANFFLDVAQHCAPGRDFAPQLRQWREL